MTPLLALALALPAQAPPAPPAAQVDVPYRLTDSMHVLVRAKINGKGPFNFIVDTGAPAMIISETIGQKIGLPESDEAFTALDRLELEGGLVVPNSKALVLDMFQLKGMNGLGLAGVELHGVIGYDILARYRIRYDFNADKLAWTPLPDFKPKPLQRARKPAKGQGTEPGGLELVGSVMQSIGGMGLRASTEVRTRGFAGFDAEGIDGGGVKVTRVLTNGPAAKAGVQVGDTLYKVRNTEMDNVKDVTKALAAAAPGDAVPVSLKRGGQTVSVTLKLSRGF